MINQILFFTAILSSLLFGYWLSNIAQEEIQSGKKYFLFSERILLLIFIVTSFTYFMFYFPQLLIIDVLLLISFLFIKRYKIINFPLAFVILIFISEPFLYYFSALLFIYGLLLGTLLPFRMTKLKK